MSTTLAAKSVTVFGASNPAAKGYFPTASFEDPGGWGRLSPLFNDSGEFSMSGYITAALRWKCAQMAHLNFRVEKYTKDKRDTMRWDVVEDHDLNAVFRHPCGMTPGSFTKTDFIRQMVSSYELKGEAFAKILFNGYDEPAGFMWLPPGTVQAKREQNSPRLVDYYEYQPRTGSRMRFEIYEVIHWRQCEGLSHAFAATPALRSVLSEVMTEREVSTYTTSIMRNLGVLGYVVSPKTVAEADGWGNDAKANLENALHEFATGDGRGGSLFSDYPLEWKEMGQTPEKMKVEGILWNVKEKIFTAMQVDPAAVYATIGYPESKSTDKKEVQSTAFEIACTPLGISLCERLTLDVLSQVEDVAVYRVGLDTTTVPALQQKLAEKHDIARKDFLANGIEQNEYRAAIGLDPRDGGEKTYDEFAQIISTDQANRNTELNGTNGVMAKERHHADNVSTVDTRASKSWRRAYLLGTGTQPQQSEEQS